MVKQRIKFYADTKIEKNKYFCYEINENEIDVLERFFDRGWHIRAAWYEEIDENGKPLVNEQIAVYYELYRYINKKYSLLIKHCIKIYINKSRPQDTKI